MTYIAVLFLYVYFSWYVLNLNGFIQALRFKLDDTAGLDLVFSGLLAVIQTILLAAFLFSHANSMLILSAAIVLSCYAILSIITVKKDDIKKIINLRRLGIVILYKNFAAVLFYPLINPFTGLFLAACVYAVFAL